MLDNNMMPIINSKPVNMGKADLHIHTSAGDGIPTVSEILEYVQEETDLDVIAITDHDELGGAVEARDLAVRRGYRFEVIVGCEVTTLVGHLLALFVDERPPMFQSLDRTIAMVHRQGGLCIVPHPMSWLAFSVGETLLRRYANHLSRDLRLDALEGFSPSVAGWVCHKRVLELNDATLGLPEVGSSDAHHLHHIGTAFTLFEGRSAADLRSAILAKRCIADGAFWSAGSHLHGAAALSWKSMVVHPSQKIYRAIGARLAAERSSVGKE